jgi:hypothetical protein
MARRFRNTRSASRAQRGVEDAMPLQAIERLVNLVPFIS